MFFIFNTSLHLKNTWFFIRCMLYKTKNLHIIKPSTRIMYILLFYLLPKDDQIIISLNYQLAFKMDSSSKKNASNRFWFNVMSLNDERFYL